ncbi:transposase [Beggiatoa sp. PS]|nr:transposase [Beggiatoa sp. PS]
MVAAWHQDLERMREEYKECLGVILTIDGLQPEKGHETLYVVRELKKQRVWFAQPLISSSYEEIRKVIQRAKDLAQQLDKPTRSWVSDKQDAFVTMIAEECPNIHHRYCSNHFIRDIAKEVLEKDSHAKVQMRRKIRGFRTIEKEILAELDQYQEKEGKLTHEQQTYAANIVLDYCAAIRGILNDNHGGPLTPSGLRMSKALEEVSQSIKRNITLPKTPIYSKLKRLHGYIKRGLSIYYVEQKEIEKYVVEAKVENTLDSETGTVKNRLAKFRRLKIRLSMPKDLIKNHMSEIMHSFEAGLFINDDSLSIPEDNLDLERWFKKPKGHERKIHGHKHVGMRIVNEGPTLLPALDAHLLQSNPFTYQDLLPHIYAEPPESQIKSVEHKRVMTKGSSKKKDRIY